MSFFNKSMTLEDNMNFKISIIIPTYNAEKTLKRAIDSIINQTIGFDNLELIIADDNSNDYTKEIIESYSKKYHNIKPIFSKTNHGYPGYGRNIGIKNATADYIMFLDNDDEYLEDYCETIYSTIMSEKVDCVSFNYQIVKKNGTFNQSSIDYVSVGERKGNKLYVNLNEKYDFKESLIWVKIFKKDLILDNNIQFIEKGLNEDTLFLYEYYYYANSLLYFDHYGYKWYKDTESLSNYSVRSTVEFIDSFYKIHELNDKLYQNVDWEKLFETHINWAIIRIILSYNNSTELNCMLNKLYDFEKYIDFNKSLNTPWLNCINKLILKRQFWALRILFPILKKGKSILDYLKKS